MNIFASYAQSGGDDGGKGAMTIDQNELTEFAVDCCVETPVPITQSSSGGGGGSKYLLEQASPPHEYEVPLRALNYLTARARERADEYCTTTDRRAAYTVATCKRGVDAAQQLSAV